MVKRGGGLEGGEGPHEMGQNANIFDRLLVSFVPRKVEEYMYFCLDVIRSCQMYTGAKARIELHYLPAEL